MTEIVKAALSDDKDLRNKWLKRTIDKLAESLTDTSYELLDLLHYPETDKLAREYRSLLLEFESKLAAIRMKER